VKQHTRPPDGELDPFFDLSLDALCVASFDGYVKRANTAFARSLGYPEAEVVARPFTDTVHPEDVESVRATFVEHASSNELTGFECRHLRADGTVLSMKWKSSPRATNS
jgi:PAS domain S-box-containing protein